MKNSMLRSMLVILTIGISADANAQFYFGISPGLQLNGAVFGYQVKKFVPYLGFQMMNGSMDLTQTGKKYDNIQNKIVDYKNVYKASGTIYMPSIGVKYFFIETGKLKAYGNLSYTKFLLSAKIEDTDNPGAPVELSKILKNTRVNGGQIGFGTEYFFDDNFSIGGEFGFRVLHLRYTEEVDEDVYNPDTGNYITTTATTNTKLNFNPTYTKFSLNFYFGK